MTLVTLDPPVLRLRNERKRARTHLRSRFPAIPGSPSRPSPERLDIRPMRFRVGLLFGLLLLSPAACKKGNVASQIAKPPELQLDGQAKCKVVASQERPLVVEWPSSDRADLEVRASRGLVVVRYEGCNMVMLPRCRAEGAYAYAPVTTKQDSVTIKDSDELYAALPAGAARFEAKLQKAGQLNVAMTIVGVMVADRVSIETSELQGDCEGATHVVVGLSVGAFEFFAGADAEIGAGATVQGAGVGAKSQAQRETLSRDGDPQACLQATRDDKAPPPNCGASLRLEVLEITKPKVVEVAPVKLECPAGTTMTDGMCVPKVSTECPAGMQFADGRGCIPKIVAAPDVPPPTEGSPARGPANAPVVITWFGEYQDPFTKRANDTLKELEKKLDGKIRIVWRNAPLAFHTNARVAAYAAMEAFAQKGDAGFWKMHDLLLASAPDLEPATLEGHAKALKLDMERFRAAIGGDTHKAKVDEDFGLFNARGFRGVPTFVVGDQVVNGAQPLDEFLAVANAQLDGGADAVPSDSPAWGAKKPVVTIEWFGDYQSPWNERVAPTIVELEKAFPGKLRFVWRSFPLGMFEHGRDAQNAVLEAAAQGKFMAMHKRLAASSRKLTRADIAGYAKEVGLDVAKVEAAMQSDRYAVQIERDIADGQKRGVTGVPAFMIGGKQVNGSQSLETFKDAVNAAMQ